MSTEDPRIVTPAKSAALVPVDFKLMAKLIQSTPDDASALREAIEALFKGWQVTTWSDLSVITSEELSEHIMALEDGDIKQKLSPLAVRKKLGYVIDYARIGTLRADLVMNDIVRAVVSSTSAAKHSVSFSGTTSEKSKTVPDLDSFSGHDEDFFEYKESTVDTLGQHGLGDYLTDSSRITTHKDTAHSVFFTLRKSLRGGTAHNLAEGLYSGGTFDPYILWQNLNEYYDTTLNRANVVLFQVKRLLGLRLDPDVLPTTFILDFQTCLLRLRKNKAKLADDNDTLRALLLVAIQDDQYQTIRTDIVQKPERDIDTIFKDIRDHDSSLQLIDREQTDSAVRSRRASASSSRGSSSSGRPGSDSKSWYVPRFPDSWKKALGPKLFQVLLNWRSSAIKGASQAQLDKDFALICEAVAPTSAAARGNNKRKARRSPAGDSVPADDDQADSEIQSTDDGSPAKRFRIRLSKSRRVVTEVGSRSS